MDYEIPTMELHPWSPVKALRARLLYLGTSGHGTKAELYARWVKAELEHKRQLEVARAIAAQQDEARRAAPDNTPAQATAPGEPSQAERELHSLTHIPAQPWCLFCLRGKSRALPHKAVHWEHRAEKPPIIMFDFMFMKSDCSLIGKLEVRTDLWATTLVGVDEQTGMSFAVVVDSKGSNNTYMHESAVEFIDATLRHRRCIVHTDGESAAVSLAKFIKLRRTHDTILETAPRYSSSSSGLVENMILRIQGQARTLRLAVEDAYKCTILVDSCCWTWLIRHANWLCCRYDKRGAIGRSPSAIFLIRTLRVTLAGNTVEEVF